MTTALNKHPNLKVAVEVILGGAAIATAVGIAGLAASSGHRPASGPVEAVDTPRFHSVEEVGGGIAGGMTRIERQVRIAIPGGESFTLPAELSVDLAGGLTGVETFKTILLPDGSVIILPTELGVDLAGGLTGLGG